MQNNHVPNYKNRPPHISTENGLYFITSRTVEGKWYLQPDAYKQIVLDTIKAKAKKFNFPLIAYVILNNHYHVITDVIDKSLMSKFMREINGASSKLLNETDRTTKKVWWNYFDKYLSDEKNFFTHLNYLHQNPIKHGLAKNFDYKFSSYGAWKKKKGEEYLNSSFEKYPVVDFKVFNDEL